MKNVKKIAKSRTSQAENEHLYRYRSRCIGTPCAKMGSGQPVPVQVEPLLVHPSSEQPISVQVKAVPVQVVPAAPLLCIFAPLSPVFLSRLFRDPRMINGGSNKNNTK